jgi:putative hemolysin
MTRSKNANLLITKDDIAKVTRFRQPLANGVATIMMSMFGIHKINALYEKHKDKPGFEFIESMIDELGIQYSLPPDNLKNIPKEGPFILVANHPFGGIEALLLFKELQHIRPDLKAMGNFLFHKIETLKPFIFPVNPFETYKDEKSSIGGLKEALQYVQQGHPLLIFPSGEVSTYYTGSQNPVDRPWMKQAIKFIKMSEVPVVPVFFQGTNSKLFHTLGALHPLMRTLKLPSELFNKRNKVIEIRIGSPISVIEQKDYLQTSRLGRYLRAKTYLLDSKIELKPFYETPLFSFPSSPEEIVPAIDPSIICEEISHLPKRYKLFSQNSYEVYCAPAFMMPETLKEIGRLREITFREVGEGTNKKTDLDEYDVYYYHLFIWNTSDSAIVGAYRVGFGKEIMLTYGVKGFYLNSLFKFKKSFHPVLTDSLELGRSFVVKEYQRNPHSLFFLWKGIFKLLINNPEYRYLVGPVSISNDFSSTSKSLLVKYISENHFNGHLAQMVKPRRKFNISEMKSDTDILTEQTTDLKSLDGIIKETNPKGMRIPVLLKKYLDLNGKIAGFNVDPKFNNSLDGLLVLDLNTVPVESLQMLSKEINNSDLLKRFNIKTVDEFHKMDIESIATF